MRYTEFRDSIAGELRRNPAGLTWRELRSRLDLPYETPCSEWVKQMGEEIGLSRRRGSGRAHVWKVSQRRARPGRA